MVNRNKNISTLLYTFLLVISGNLLISSCGKGTTKNAVGLNVQYQVVNLSPNLQPVDLYIDFRKYNSGSYSYPMASGYFALTSIDTPLQIRPAATLTTVSTSNLFSLDNILKPNLKYTLFITGLRTDTIHYIFTTDTASVPTVGRGKIRFLNASPRTQGLDLLANNTVAFTNQAFTKVSQFIEIPAGNYDFKITPTGSSTTVLKDMPNISIQDGRLYTLYTFGLTGHTDTAAFNAAMITNR